MPYPYVSNEGSFGQGFLDAFSQFYGISSNRKRQKEQDKIAEAARTRQQEERDAELALQGIMRGTAPTEEAPAPLGEQFRQAAVAPPSVRRPMGPPTLDEATAMQDSAGLEHMPPPRLPGAFDPNTGTFTPAIPRYRQLNRGFYVDETMTPEGRTRAEMEAERGRRGQNLRTAGIPEDKVGLALDTPGIIDNLLPKETEPKEVSRDEQLRARIQALHLSGMTLRAANEQARLEFGGVVTDEGPQKADKPTDSVRRARLLYNVAKQAAPILERATAPGFFESMAAQANANELLDEERQITEQAARQFVSSYLYLVSGATATPGEIESLTQQIIPQRGAKAGVTARQAAAVRTMLREMGAFAGIETGPAPKYPENPY